MELSVSAPMVHACCCRVILLPFSQRSFLVWKLARLIFSLGVRSYTPRTLSWYWSRLHVHDCCSAPAASWFPERPVCFCATAHLLVLMTLLVIVLQSAHMQPALMRSAPQWLMPSNSGSKCPYLLKSIQFNSPIYRHGNQTFLEDNDLLEQS